MISRIRDLLRRFRRLSFSVVGGMILVLGYTLLAIMIGYFNLNPSGSYLLVAVLSIELNFFLNRWLGWSDRAKPGTGWNQWRRFHITRIITFPLNQLIFNLVLALGFSAFWASLLGLGVTILVNYQGLNRYVFRDIVGIEPDTLDLPSTPIEQYQISVIIPANNEGKTIRQCILSILDQSYKASEIILVTGPNDSTLEPIQDFIQDGLVRVVFFERPITWVGRDTNARRLLGLLAATGKILVLTDAKIFLPNDWLKKIAYHVTKGEEVIAGITERMRGDNSFFALLSDKGLYSENTRFVTDYLDKTNFGKVKGLPVTANLAFTEKVFAAIRDAFPQQGFSGWEDFALSSLIVLSGFRIRTDNNLVTHRMHRASMRLAKHLITGMSARHFYLNHPDNDFAKNRNRHASIVGLVYAFGFVFHLIIYRFLGLQNLLILMTSETLSFFITFGLLNAVKANHWLGFFFPPIILLQISIWVTGYWFSALLNGEIPPWIAENLKRLRTLLVVMGVNL